MRKAARRALEAAASENAAALSRKVTIEKRKEEAERLMLERELEAEQARAAAEAAAREQAVAAGQLPDPVLKFGIDNVPANGPDRGSLTRDFMTQRRIGLSQEITRSEKRQLRSERFERDAQRVQAQRQLTLANLQRDTALAACYAAADVFVFPSRTDTFGLVLLEALACGVPIAAFPVAGPVDVRGGFTTGAFVRPSEVRHSRTGCSTCDQRVRRGPAAPLARSAAIVSRTPSE